MSLKEDAVKSNEQQSLNFMLAMHFRNHTAPNGQGRCSASCLKETSFRCKARDLFEGGRCSP